MIWTLIFWKRTIERMIAAMAAAALGGIGTNQFIEAIEWTAVISVTALTGVMMLLSSLAASHVADKGTPDWVRLSE